MRVIDIARKATVSPETVRYYVRLGLLEPSRDPQSYYKVFDEADYARLCFIRDVRAMGIPIVDVQTIVDASRQSRRSYPGVMSLLRERLAIVRTQIAKTIRAECQLSGIIRRWEQLPKHKPSGSSIATAIDRWPEDRN